MAMRERTAPLPQGLDIKNALKKGLRAFSFKSRFNKAVETHPFQDTFIPIEEYKKPITLRPISETVLFARQKPQRSARTR